MPRRERKTTTLYKLCPHCHRKHYRPQIYHCTCRDIPVSGNCAWCKYQGHHRVEKNVVIRVASDSGGPFMGRHASRYSEGTAFHTSQTGASRRAGRWNNWVNVDEMMEQEEHATRAQINSNQHLGALNRFGVQKRKRLWEMNIRAKKLNRARMHKDRFLMYRKLKPKDGGQSHGKGNTDVDSEGVR